MKLKKIMLTQSLLFGLTSAAWSETKSNTSQTAKASNGKQTEANQQKTAAEPEGIIFVITTSDLAERTGCWAKVYDGLNFTGRNMTLVEGMDLPNLEFSSFGYDDWEGDIDSVVVGPKAKLTLYGGENFTDPDKSIGPNSRISSLSKPNFDDIESIKMTCG